jgi:cobalt/nickel transport system permease protein
MHAAAATQLDRHAWLDTAAHRLDPRAKLLATLVFTVAVLSFTKYAVAPLLIFALYPLALSVYGHVPARLVAARLLWMSPFVLAVALFNPLLDRDPMVRLGPFVLSGGWVSFASIAVRFALVGAAAVALVATTPLPRLGQAMSRLGVPAVLVVQLLFLYRYLFVLIDEARRLMRARDLRAGERGRHARSLRVAAAMLSALFVRTLERAERIHRAMLARGFHGELPLVESLRWRAVDTAFLIAVAAGCVAMRLWPIHEILAGIGGFAP